MVRLNSILLYCFPYVIYCTAASINNLTSTIDKSEERYHQCNKRQENYGNKSLFRSVFVFGDSLTDNNAFEYVYKARDVEITRESLHSYSTVNMKRYSNGPLWVEYLADMFNHADLYNFARTAATVNNSLVDRHQIPDIIDQVNRYITSRAFYKHQPDALHLIWAGGNDLNDLFKLFLNDGNNRTEIIDGIVSSLCREIEMLQAVGAKYIVVMNVNPVQDIPDHYHQSVEQRNTLRDLIFYFNSKLKAGIEIIQARRLGQQQEKEKPEGRQESFHVAYFDTYEWFNSTYPADVVIANNGTTCKEGKDCGDLIWWDILHFTTKVYANLAQGLYDFILCEGWLSA